jgi:hypothetical protein
MVRSSARKHDDSPTWQCHQDRLGTKTRNPGNRWGRNLSEGRKQLKLRLPGSARKSQKRFRDTPMFKFQAVLAQIQPFLSRNVEKRGDQSRVKCLGFRTGATSNISDRERRRCRPPSSPGFGVLAPPPPPAAAASCAATSASASFSILISAKETPRFQRFHLFVPSLSWQKDRFTNRNGSKKARFFCTVDNNLVVKVAHELLRERGKVRRAAVALDKLDLRHPRLACGPRALFLSAFPMFVPSLSWQSDAFSVSYQMARQKSAFFSPHL